MTKILSTLFFCFCISVSFTQEDPEILSQSAFNKYISSQPDSALILYKAVREKFPDYYPGMILKEMGDCYLAKGNIDLAESAYLESEKHGKFFRQDCYKLAGIYVQKRNYKTALHYLRLSEKMPAIKMCFGRIDMDIRVNYLYAQCYAAMDKPSKAINRLTSSVFYSENKLRTDSLHYNEIIHFYSALLREKYTDKRIYKEFQKVTRNLSYKNHIGWDSRIVSFTFFGNKVQLEDFSFENTMSDKSFKAYTKENILRALQQTSAWKALAPSEPS